ncbi:MAG: tetratricopeptide repeat protein [Chitinophagaceae bacterium]|nr:tetratricopeptide repeat protein [Chitinophagaceae bacterium]
MRKLLIGLCLMGLFITSVSQQQKIDSLLKEYAKGGSDTVHTKVCILLSENYRNTQIDSAVYFAQKGLSLARERKQGRMEAYAQNALGYALYFKGDYQGSILAFRGYYDAAKKNDDAIAMGFARNNEGNVHIELGDYVTALERYHEALDIRTEARDTAGIAMSYNNLGYIYKDLGDYEKAVSNFLYALRIFEKQNDQKAIAATYTYLAAVYRRKKDFQLALDNLNKAYLIQKTQMDYSNMGISLHAMATVYGEQLKYDSAHIRFEEARILYEKNKDMRQLALLSADLAEIFSRQQQYDSAVHYYQQAIDRNNSIGNKRSLASIFLGKANALLLSHQSAMVLPCLDSAMNIIQQTGNKEDYKNYYKISSDYYTKIGNSAKALELYTLYNTYKDSLLNESNQKAIADMQVKYNVEKKDQQIRLQQSEILRRNILLGSSLGLTLLLALLGLSYYKRQKLKQQTRLQEEIMHQQDMATKAVIEAEENERKRIGSDLHDGIGQLMSAAKMNLSALEDRLNFANDQDKLAFEKSISLVDESCKEVRSVSHAIMPNALLRRGLSNAVKEFLDKIDSQVLKINLHSEGLNERLDTNVETVLYRVIQECVNNVIKHSGANMLDISLIKDAEGISATIEDNGHGFNVAEKEKADGIGLKNIHARVTYLKGELEIDSAPGRGTVVVIHVPL